MTISIIVLEQ